MPEIITTKPRDGPLCLIPATQMDLDALAKVRPNKLLRTRITFDRSLPAMRWWRGLLAIVGEGLGIDPAGIHAELKFKTGFIRRIYTSQAFGVAVELESAAFNSWDEQRFTEFRSLAIPLLFETYLPGVKRKDIFRRVEQMLGPCPW
jgi:hypothetical protein